MFDIFKKDVVVKCYDLDELAKILDWYRAQHFHRMADVDFPVVVRTNGIFNAYEEGPKVLWFEVSIPYSDFKALKNKFIESECFDPIFESRAIFHQVFGRVL